LEDQAPSLTELNFDAMNVPFKDVHIDQIQDLAEMWASNETVVRASFRGKHVNNVVISYIFPQLAGNLALEEIDCSDNSLIDDNAVRVLESFITKTKTVSKLNLSGCSFTDKGKKALTAAKEKNPHLELVL
jgi:hypothetical protein